jgi:hypothetical protein
MTDQQVEDAIFMRREGSTWAHIAKITGRPQQTIQQRIWKYLYVTGQLNRGVIHSIWIEGHSEQHAPASWGWLERKTGIYCTENGTEHGFRIDGGSTWGKRLHPMPEPARRAAKLAAEADA